MLHGVSSVAALVRLVVLLCVICHGMLTIGTANAAEAEDAEWVIGLDADLSAVAVESGLAIRRGAEMAIAEINQRGGVLGRQLRLEARDHRGNPARGAANIKAFSRLPNLIAVIGGKHSPVFLHQVPLAHELGVIMVSPWAAANPIIDHDHRPANIYRVSVRDEHAATVLLSDAAGSGIKKVGLLLERTGWGRSNESSMQVAANHLGIEIVAVQWFNWKQTSVAEELGVLKAKGAEGLVLVANVPEGVVAVRDMASYPEGDILPIWSHWGILSQEFVDNVGLANLNRVKVRTLQTVTFAEAPLGSKRADVLAKYQATYGTHQGIEPIPAGVGFAHAYDIVHLLGVALDNAGDNEVNKLRTALDNLPPYQGLVKQFAPAFTADRREALNLADYQVAEFDATGRLLPVH